MDTVPIWATSCCLVCMGEQVGGHACRLDVCVVSDDSFLHVGSRVSQFSFLGPKGRGWGGQGLAQTRVLYEHMLCVYPAGHVNGVFFLYPVPSFLTRVLITYKSGNDRL